VWQGWPLYLQVNCKRGASGGLTLGLYLAIQPPCRTAGALIHSSLKAVAVNGGSGITGGHGACPYTGENVSWGLGDFFALADAGDDGSDAAAPKDWAGVVAALSARRLVHSDSVEAHVKLRCTVTRLE
jgi:hypothetical protein